MNAILNVTTKIIAFADTQVSNNPRLKYTDWYRDISGISVQDPKSEGHLLAPGEVRSIFNGTRATTIDNTTAFSVSLSTLNSTTYRFTYVSGTNPTLRTGRNIVSSGVSLTFTVNTNATVLLHSATAIFGSVVAGDNVFIPNTTTGDAANVISVLNSGYWQVLSVTDTQNIVLIRLPGTSFEAQNQTVTPANNSQLRIYSAAGVQIGDSVDVSAGFNAAALQTYTVNNVTDLFFEVTSTVPLPAQASVTPTATGMIFYTDNKQFLYLESDQLIVVQANGDTGSSQRVQPVEPGDPNNVGVYMRRGATWSLTLVNRSTSQANVTILHCE